MTVHTAGTAAEGGDPPKLLVQHAAVNEEQYYVDFPSPIAVDLTQVGLTWIHVPYFMRYVGWVVTGTIGDAPVASLDVLTKG